MRIVAGERRGMQLVAPRGDAVRPTSDRVRQALFSMLGDISGAIVLDAFAGTGALALEALSRGAAHAHLCERSPVALTALRRNVDRLGYGSRVTVERIDAVRRISRDQRRGARYDLILLDPPYRILAALQQPLAQHLAAILEPDGVVALEGPSGSPLLELPLRVERARIHGGTRIALLRHPAAT
ncbi:MAG TPA: RsmD family RNA methyltransferase [Gaiellales bacterium]|nr:RsmD family RNA methyltransferase [Gaiellales bacterium]